MDVLKRRVEMYKKTKSLPNEMGILHGILQCHIEGTSINKLNQCMKISLCSIRMLYTNDQITRINHNFLPPSNLLRGS